MRQLFLYESCLPYWVGGSKKNRFCVDSLTHPLLVRLDLVLNSTQAFNRDDNIFLILLELLEVKRSILLHKHLNASFSTTFAAKQQSMSLLTVLLPVSLSRTTARLTAVLLHGGGWHTALGRIGEMAQHFHFRNSALNSSSSSFRLFPFGL